MGEQEAFSYTLHGDSFVFVSSGFPSYFAGTLAAVVRGNVICQLHVCVCVLIDPWDHLYFIIENVHCNSICPSLDFVAYHF